MSTLILMIVGLIVLFVPALFVWLVLMQPTRKQKKHGFEVITTPGKTPGLIEKKEK